MLKLALTLSALRLWRGKFAFFCQLCALSAVMAPLLVILGLKHGILTSMRENLLGNPATLELWFVHEKLNNEDIDAIRQLPETAFLQPRLSTLYAQVSIVPAGQPAGNEIYRLEATGEGDPLLAKAGIDVPKKGEVVLSAPMARTIGVRAGSVVTITTSRNSKSEQQAFDCTVIGVLPEALDRDRRIYVPATLCMQVEVFIKQGHGIPGEAAQLPRQCYSALVLTEGEAAAQQQACTHLAGHDANRAALAATRSSADTHPTLPPGTWMLFKEGHALSAVDAKALHTLALEKNVLALPWNPPCEARLRSPKGEAAVLLHSRLELPQGDYSFCPAPEDDGWADPRNGPVLEVPAELVTALGGNEAELVIPTAHGESCITCQLSAAEGLAEGEARTNPQFAALCRRAKEIPTRWNYHTGAVHYPIVTHFSNMRLYARDLESVEPLYRKLRQRGLNPSGNLKIIRELLSLEHALNTLYLLISCGAAVGAVFSIAMSLFNSVEHHRKHYAQLLTMGMRRLPLAAIPLFEGLITTTMAFAASLGIFHAIAKATDALFASAFHAGNRLCVLLPQHALFFLACACAVAAIAAVAATIRILLISPSESLREL